MIVNLIWTQLTVLCFRLEKILDLLRLEVVCKAHSDVKYVDEPSNSISCPRLPVRGLVFVMDELSGDVRLCPVCDSQLSHSRATND